MSSRPCKTNSRDPQTDWNEIPVLKNILQGETPWTSSRGKEKRDIILKRMKQRIDNLYR